MNIKTKFLGEVEIEQVKLGIVAPKSIKVHRSEVFEAIQQQNKEALATSVNVLKQFRLKK